MSGTKQKVILYGTVVAMTLALAVSLGTGAFAPVYAAAENESMDHEGHEMHAEKEWRKPAKQSVNDVMIEVKFRTSSGSETIDTFTSFTQTGGYARGVGVDDRRAGSPATFTLTGLVGPEKHNLYEMADYFYKHPSNLGIIDPRFSSNGITVNLNLHGVPIRSFDYVNCDITDYHIETLDDGIYTYQEDQGMGIAIVDVFSFECNGYEPKNNYHNTVKNMEKNGKTGYSSLDYKKEQRAYLQSESYPKN
ncbi:hypothetical protein C6988_03760 [Nitrosopumilus sp. b1]|uniref:hypothetical protein n=1 Tax=Nitrosopumilus sp. b1 TaxID=2109907 RepID=UPI0015F359FF|nr:hypothetical protein [Nitrosopumilus sp. b1]KAF6243370.1 hypothetical protein C6988_03760 [Nitrosopumilus sp. b1]